MPPQYAPAYGMDLNSLRYLNDYLSNRMQRVRINNDFSQCRDIIYGVPQGSILRPYPSIYT